MKQLLTLLFALILMGCNSTKDTKNRDDKAGLTIEKDIYKPVDFDIGKFKVLKGQLGTIRIGMTIQEAERQFSGLTKKVDEATNFGFGGGSPAYLYYLGNELIFALLPKLQSDTLLFIIAANEKLQTANGLNPKSTVKDLIQKYPDLTVQQDLMNNWEFIQDKKHGWDFIFMTNERTEIGEYPELEAPSKPKRLTAKAEWITIR